MTTTTPHCDHAAPPRPARRSGGQTALAQKVAPAVWSAAVRLLTGNANARSQPTP